MSEDYHGLVGEALGQLIDGLTPYVTGTFAELLPAGMSWTELLRRKDAMAGQRNRRYEERDLSLILRALTERLGDLGYPFGRSLSRQGQACASELREVRNLWAHNAEFPAAAAFRALDSAELLLREVGADTQADLIAPTKLGLLPTAATAHVIADDDAGEADATSAGADADRPDPGGTKLSLEAQPVLSYPMAHGRIAVVEEITVQHTGRDLRGASVELDVLCAEGSLGGPKVLMLDLADGQTTSLRDVDLMLDPARMLAVDEQQPGRIRAVLRDAEGTSLAETSVDVEVLASSHWMAEPQQLAMEMLAAHVQPNSPAIASLLLAASDRLRETTGRSALDGYQSDDPERVHAMAEAIYHAMRGLDIRYAEPPASWGAVGQRVRTPSEVLEGRLGTCLDTTVTYAAALEQAGINSTLWLFRGHILVGYWSQDASLAVAATPEPTEVVNVVDMGLIVPVETTLLTGGPESRPFTDARRAGKARVTGGLDDAVGVTDVRESRRSRIYPLPSRSIGVDGSVEVHEYTPGAAPLIEAYRPSDRDGMPRERRDVPARVAKWKNALLDLSLRNKLINYTDRSGFRLEVPGTALARLEDQINADVTITLTPSDAVTGVDAARGIRFGRDLPAAEREVMLAQKRAAFIDITSAAYTGKLRYLAYKAKTIVEETGSNNLYLSFGMLSWKLGERDLHSPLVLVPVQLSTTSRGSTYRMRVDEAGASTPNYCLLEKLRITFGLEIPELAVPAEDASGIDLEATFDAVRRAIAKSSLPFRVDERVELAILQFAKFPLWKDLDENWEQLAQNSLVRHLVHSPLEPFADPVEAPADVDLDALGELVPIPADSSQLEAVSDAVAGRTFVLEGPPGTGKSQTITNLLARALAKGKRVLFVAEKRAALDVVKKRLESVGLGDLSLDLHDKSARPAAVRAQIQAALDLRAETDSESLRAASESAHAARRRLATYAARLHEENAVGHSLYSARTFDLAAEQTIAPLELPRSVVESATPEAIGQIRTALRDLPEYADLARPRPRHPWRFLDADDRTDVGRLHDVSRRFDVALAAVVEAGVPLAALGRLAEPSQIRLLADVDDAGRHPLSAIDALHRDDWRAHLQRVRASAEALATARDRWRAVVTPDVMWKDVSALHSEALLADAAGIFTRKRRRRAVLAQLADHLVPGAAIPPLKSLSQLTADLASTYEQVVQLRLVVQQVPLSLVDASWNPGAPEDAARLRDEIDVVVWLGHVLAPTGSATVDDLRSTYAGTPRGHAAAALRVLADAWDELNATATHDPAGIERWLNGGGFLVAWWETRNERRVDSPVTLERWTSLVRHVEPLRRHGLAVARDALLDGHVVAEDAVIAFDRGLARTSIDERQEATTLGDFDVAAHARTIERFTHATRRIRDELPRAIPHEVLAQRRFDVMSSTGQIGGLTRQLRRERGGMKVRALMENYGDLITQIMPCTLISPESVARFFPARPGLFDIVVFDEASQIRVADAIGAMGRASAVVVVGDSKQMPPTQFAEASASVEEDEEPTPERVEDEESILSECVQGRVPSKWLSWHYRSQDESLIAFSNHFYYKNRLSSFPAPLPEDPRRHPAGFGISLVRVNGHFERSGHGRTLRTNRLEAEQIVADVQQRFDASPDRSPSLGIITFNVQQRNLIENLLRDSDDERIVAALDEPDGLFVKNLENVQGDERDCILFSVAFSANDKGVIPLNFGPLSKPGGERRLNVAVTRARRQVVLYASFAPSELRAEETSQVGPKHLKAYLELAANGVETVRNDGRRRSTIDHHRDDIAGELRNAGYAVRTDVGLSDFRVDISVAAADDPESPLVAVLLDGPSWRERRTVSDRDGLPVEVLQRLMHWPAVERVWLPEWMHRRGETLARLTTAVTGAREALDRGTTYEGVSTAASLVDARSADAAGGPGPGAPAGPAVDGPGPNLATTVPVKVAASHEAHIAATPKLSAPRGEAPRTPPGSMRLEHVEWRAGRRGDVDVLDALPSPRAAAKVRSVATEAIEAEGPVQPDRLAKLVAGTFGLGRVGEDRKKAIKRLVGSQHRRDTDDFYWPESIDPDTWLYVRAATASRPRHLEEVSLVEIANAMRLVAEQSGGASAEELKRGALALFGGRRITEAIGKRLDAGLRVAVERGRVQVRESGVYVAAN